jgi:hypothetical protein
VQAGGALGGGGALTPPPAAGIIGWKDESGALRRLSYWTLLTVALPGWIVMRVGAEWIASKEGLDNLKNDPTWLGIGMATADGGGLLLLISLIVGGIGVRRMRNGGGNGLIKASSVIATVLVAVYVVTVWAMGGKPS